MAWSLFQFDEKDDALFVSDCDRDWDEFSQGFFACPDLWAAGGGNSTDHIIPANSMQPELRLSFVRVMRENADLPRIKSEPADGENVKSESSTSDAKSLSNANKKSSARNSRGGVRESWKVSPTKEDSNSKLNGPTSNSNDSLSNSNSSNSSNNSNSKHNANSTDENSETKVKCEENGLIKDEDSCVDSAVKKGSSPAKKKNSNSTTEDVIQELEARSGLR